MTAILLAFVVTGHAAEPPLAIPADPPTMGAPSGTPAPAPQAVRTYRAERLALLPITEMHVGTAYETAYGPGWGFFTVPVPFLYQTESFGVFQGNRRLDVPNTLGALGQTTEKASLERRIATNRGAGHALSVVGVAGVAATVVGLVGLDRARTYPEARTYATVSSAGATAMIGGLVLGAFPSARARRLHFDHTATIEHARLEEQIAAHNAALAAGLGLTPAQAEAPAPRRRRR